MNKPFVDQRKETLLAQVIPGRSSTHPQKVGVFEATMASLCHEQREVALEIAKGASGQKQFLLRAVSRGGLAHLAAQIQVSLPQAEIRRRDQRGDPLRLSPGEEVTVIELFAGAPPYQSLRLFWPQSQREQQGGTDPLLGILAALDHLPEGVRAVAQLALSPLPSNWGHAYERLAYEHPLSAERERRMQERQRKQGGRSSPVSWGSILALGLLASLLVAWPHLVLSRFVPPFLINAGDEVLQGNMPSFTTEQSLFLLGTVLGIVMLLALFTGLIRLLLSRFGQKPLYDPKKVADKINRSAYRARLRLYVISARPLTEKAEQQFQTGQQNRKEGQFMRSMPSAMRASHLSLWIHPSALWRKLVSWWGQRQAVNVRSEQRQRALKHLVAAYRAFQADAYFVPRQHSTRRAKRLLAKGEAHSTAMGFGRVLEALWAADVSRSKLVLSAQEVAALWHLPLSSDASELPWLERREERSLLVPHELTQARGWPLGYSRHAGQEAEVILPFTELGRHKLVLGRTGKGKSTLFQHIALAQLASGTGGLCVVEPHGDLIARLLELIPPERSDEVILINLADRLHPVGINPLDMMQQSDIDRATSTLLSTLKAIWSQSGAWGARQENALRMGIRTLLLANQDLVAELGEQGHNQQYTVLDLVPLFEYQGFRRRVLARVSDIYLRNWWFAFFERLETSNQDDIVTPIITKISAYSSSEASRRILGQPTSSIHFPEIVKRGGILLINTSSAHVGRDVSSLLGATLLGFFSEALSHQLMQERRERRAWLMLIDEFSNYPVNYEHLLSEMRKAGLALTLAAQSLSQLDKQDETLRPTVFANAEHLFVFALSGEDAFLCLRELGSSLTVEDLVKQADLSCYVRLSQSGKPLPLFSMHLSIPPTGDPASASSILQRSRREGRPAEEVDQLLWTLAARHTPFGKQGGEKNTKAKEEGEDEDDGGMSSTPPPSSPPPFKPGGTRQGGKSERKQSGRNQSKRGSSHHQAGEGVFP